MEIQNMIDSADIEFKEALKKLEQINSTETNILSMEKQLKKSINDAIAQLKEQQEWLNTYLSKGKLGRKSMFYKVSWYGIPVN
jgi:predicted transcriptional regulator